MYGYIYETTNLVNGKKYIGQRKAGRPEPYLGSGKHIRCAIKKYGIENFSKRILHECGSKEELDRMEVHYIAAANAVSDDKYYNIAIGGNTPMTGLKLSDEHRRKISEAQKGHVVSDETKRKMSASKRNMSDETRKKMSEAQKNRPPVSDETRRKRSELAKGRVMSDKTRINLLKANKGRIVSIEGRMRMSEAARNRSEETKERMREANRVAAKRRIGTKHKKRNAL